MADNLDLRIGANAHLLNFIAESRVIVLRFSDIAELNGKSM
jgi:hypothetical protein